MADAERTIREGNQMRLGSDVNGQQEFTQVVARATEVFANLDKALRWLGSPARDLHNATPVSLLGRPEGQAAVLAVLDNIEHGAF